MDATSEGKGVLIKTRMDVYFDAGESQPRAPKEKAATPARASSKSIKITAMGFKRLRNGEQRDGEMERGWGMRRYSGNRDGNNDTTQNQTQVAQRGAARSRPEWMISFFLAPPARRAGNAEGVRTRTPGKQATLSAVGIEVTPVVVSGTANEKEARNYINKGERARPRTRRDMAGPGNNPVQVFRT
jgi:hypothetical protein